MDTRQRNWGYAVVGAILALGSPLGLLLMRAVLESRAPSPQWLIAQLRRDPVTYLYFTVSTCLLFAIAGYWLGRYHDRLVAISQTDPLTGLANRRYLSERVRDDLLRARRHGSPVSLLLIDVDRLKDINDRHGHKAGDEALRTVAEAIRRTVRRTDVAARFGGDEFAVLAPLTAGDDARELSERICTALRELTAAHACLSVSIGVADSSGSPPLDPDALYVAADRALYRAKLEGRDRVVLHASPATR